MTNAGGWEKSELCQKMNSGEIWNLMPSDFQSKVKLVRKLTNNVGGGSANKGAAVTVTSDELFLLSYSEIVPISHWASGYPWTCSEGTQCEAFRGRVTEDDSDNELVNESLEFGELWWERSMSPYLTNGFFYVASNGYPSGVNFDASYSYCVCPAWSF